MSVVRYGFHIYNLRAFSWKYAPTALFVRRRTLRQRLDLTLKSGVRIYLDSILTTATHIQSYACHTALRLPIVIYGSYGILTVCPIRSPVWDSLRAKVSLADKHRQGNLGLSACRVLTYIVVTCANSLSSTRSTVGRPIRFIAEQNALLPPPYHFCVEPSILTERTFAKRDLC